MNRTVFLAVVLSTAVAHAGQGIDPKDTDADFAIQGEYVSERAGAQVVALGDGAFDVYLLCCGLPGANWDGDPAVKIPGRTVKGRVVIGEGEQAITKDGYGGKIADGVLTLTNDAGVSITLKRVVRRSPTLGAKPPEGAIVLFDGSSTEGWVARNGKPIRLTNRCLNPGGTGGLNTRRKLGSVKLHLEFMTSYMPKARGQGRSNSGVYLAGRHEAQVLDSFGLRGKMNEAGGLYSVKDPDLNMCFPPLSWQTYDIEYRLSTPERGVLITVVLNGVTVQDKVETRKQKTTAGVDNEATDKPGPLHLQDHGNPVLYRNIWVVELK